MCLKGVFYAHIKELTIFRVYVLGHFCVRDLWGVSKYPENICCSHAFMSLCMIEAFSVTLAALSVGILIPSFLLFGERPTQADRHNRVGTIKLISIETEEPTKKL